MRWQILLKEQYKNGTAGELYRIVKTLADEKKRTSTVVNDKNGKPTNEQSERLKIWKEHFDTVLNKEPPVRPLQPHEIETRQNDREFPANRGEKCYKINEKWESSWS